MKVANQDIRIRVAQSGLKLWQIAVKLGVTDSTFSRKLRQELPTETKNKIFDIIEQLKEGE